MHYCGAHFFVRTSILPFYEKNNYAFLWLAQILFLSSYMSCLFQLKKVPTVLFTIGDLKNINLKIVLIDYLITTSDASINHKINNMWPCLLF